MDDPQRVGVAILLVRAPLELHTVRTIVPVARFAADRPHRRRALIVVTLVLHGLADGHVEAVRPVINEAAGNAEQPPLGVADVERRQRRPAGPCRGDSSNRIGRDERAHAVGQWREGRHDRDHVVAQLELGRQAPEVRIRVL